MLEPTPLLRPSPLELSDVFSGAFAVLKVRFGTFALITFIPLLVSLVSITGALVSMAALLPELATLPSGGRLSPGPLAGYIISLVVAALIQPLLSLKATAMMMVGTYETTQGQTPTFASLWRDTKGFVLRILPLVLTMVLIVGLIYVVIAAAIVATASAASLGDSSQAAVGVVALVAILAFLVGIPLAIYFGVKLIYVLPVIGIEKLSSFAGLKRGWSLTRGAFWRTLGYYLVAVILVQGVAMMVSSVVQAGMTPVLGTMPKADNFAELQAMFAVLVPAYVISMAAQTLVQVMATPFQNAYLTIMYLDQRRRTEAPAPVATGYPTPPMAGWQQDPANPAWGTQPPPPPPSWNPPPPPPSDQGNAGPS